MFKILDGRTELWQWDLDRKIVVDDPTIAEVHFCNGKSDCSLVTAVRTENGKRIADIPNILLQDHPQCKLRGYFELRVFAYCAGDYTKAETTIKVNARTKPESYEYTETAEVKYRIVEILQTKGKSETAVMSQKAVSVAISDASSRVEKRITNIERGLTPDPFATDDSMAYQKDVPANALPYAAVNKIGGMTYKDGNTLRSAKVTDVKSVGVNLFDKSAAILGYQVGGNGSVFEDTLRFYSAAIPVNGGDKYMGSGADWINFYTTENPSASNFVGQTNPENMTVPAGAKYARVCGKVANIDAVAIYKGNTIYPYTPYQEHSLPIPEEVRPANGINENVYDYIEWAEDGSVKKTVKCGAADLRTIYWEEADTGVWYTRAFAGIAIPDIGLCDKYEVIPEMPMGNAADKTIQIRADVMYIKDTSITDASQITGTLLYALANPTTEDISDLITADNLIGVEGGGTITFENEHGNAVPSEITYQLKGATA